MKALIKKVIIFCAEYLVIAQGMLFILLLIKTSDVHARLTVLISGAVLLMVSLTVAEALKKIIHKKRPPQKREYFIPLDRYAFPSAHATVLFSLTVFMLRCDIWIGIVSLLITLCIVVARVHAHVHDYVDIVGGLILGVTMTYMLTPYILGYVMTYLVPALLRFGV